MRKPRTGLTLLLACLVIFALAPAAAAQLPSDPVGTINDTLGGGSGGTIGDVVDEVDDTLGGGTGTIVDDGTTEPELLEEATKEITDTVENPEKKITDTTSDPIGSVDGTLGSTTDTATNDVNEISKTLTGTDGKNAKSRKKTSKDGLTTGSGRLAAAEAYHDKVFEQSLAARLADAKNRSPVTLTSSTTSTESSGLAGVIQQIGRVAAEAVQQAAFPLLLTLLVGAFLIGQNRIDRRDPKLAMAPVDSDQDLLSFT